MSRIISRAESFERAYEAFNQINFSAFDYTTVKQSMIEYIKTYFPEDFNDYIESSEFIAILELFAYMAELVSYRLDINAQENFITQAQRKQSILRLAKLISYKASRNVPARGFVKVNSIRTSENVLDTDGNNLANTTIRWNDPNNPNWKTQFIQVINRVFQQPFGSVSPSERVQVQDVVFELYQLRNIPTQFGVVPFSASVSGRGVPMELVPVDLTDSGPTERRPQRNQPFSLVYSSDGLGDGSATTGFLIHTKQGSLQRQTTAFDGITPNITFDVANTGINDLDLWLNNVDSDTGRLLTNGRWTEVDTVAGQNIAFNTVPERNKYEVETLENDGVRLVFGDGQYANVPSGTFDIWHRTSLQNPLVIPQNRIVNQTVTFNYLDIAGNVQTITMTFSLINTLQNASASETVEQIRRNAPATYFTQDRMVTAQDYNTFPLQDPTIAKLRAVNRTFAGDSKYIPWHDPSETYENVKIFGNDLYLYYEDGEGTQSSIVATPEQVLDSFIEPILATEDFRNAVVAVGVDPTNVRTTFTTAERSAILAELNNATASSPTTVSLYYAVEPVASPAVDLWEVTTDPVLSPPTSDPTTLAILWEPEKIPTFQGNYSALSSYSTGDVVRSLSDFLYYEANTSIIPGDAPPSANWDLYRNTLDPADQGLRGFIEATYEGNSRWSITRRGNRIVAESPTTQFWNTNDNSQVVTDDALNNAFDNIVILNANVVPSPNYITPCATCVGAGNILPDNIRLRAIQQVNDPVTGLPDIHKLSIVPFDTNDDGLPDFDIDTDDDGDPNININQLVAPDRATALDNPLNFAWFHYAVDRNLIDPAASNIIDMFVLTRGYVQNVANWVAGETTLEPTPPTPLDLRLSYNELLEKKMISDTVVLRSGRIRLILGDKAEPELRGQLKVIKSPNATLTNNRIKTEIVDVVNEFFNIDLWEFGETFYFTELAAAIHQRLPGEVSSVVIVPTFSDNQFGDLFQVVVREDEVIQPDVTVDDIVIVDRFTDDNLRLEPN